MRSEDKIASSVAVPERSSPREVSFPVLVSSLVPHLFRWGETETPSLVPGTRSHWDLGSLMPEAEERQLGSRKEDGSSVSMCEEAETIPQPRVAIPQL